MTEGVTIAGRQIGAGHPCYIIAEAGSNHDGYLARALELMDAAASAGADAVKFQLFSAEELYPSNCGRVPTPSGDVDFFPLLQSLEVPYGWIPELMARARQLGIVALFSVFDESRLRVVFEFGTDAIKIASPELTHLPLLRSAAHLGLPIVLSTGMSTLGDIDEALSVLRRAGGRDVVLLHCVTAYPCMPGDCNLAVLRGLEAAFDLPVGFSDHTTDPVAAPIAAVAYGATVIEKHFTGSRSGNGPDHSFALEPMELGRLVRAVREIDALPSDRRISAVTDRLGAERVRLLRGRSTKVVVADEAVLAACDRRSIHATKDIEPGVVLSAGNLAILRGERNLRPGLHPRYWDVLLGARACRPIALGQGIVWDDVLTRDEPGLR